MSKLILVCLIFALCLPVVAIAQTEVETESQISPIRYDERFHGYFYSDSLPLEQYRLEFEGQAGDWVQIYGGVDWSGGILVFFRIQLLDPADNILAAGFSDETMLPLRLPSDGQYTIVVTVTSYYGAFFIDLYGLNDLPQLNLDEPLDISFNDTNAYSFVQYDSPSAQPLRLEAEILQLDRSPFMMIYALDPEPSLIFNGEGMPSNVIDPILTEANTRYLIASRLVLTDAALEVRLSLSASEIEPISDPTPPPRSWKQDR